ncbi:DHA2 family efflux MFS transporter permease subunit [Sphingomonas sp.]|jgi:DHA2 family multidrug resistance protein|uniref:DHA2 family efflux MFS transporter permease subunit n=1 Tax=Sphingomonas sp. TaxID=28214 RepID=UPI002DEF64D1|nr:DHA2 family efflux MFS transporter permease subunit [Sphingomonas sp.]HEV2568939.1 DHA2 family efflux MFS transporter permease subunit [Sphingomonas sp.]
MTGKAEEFAPLTGARLILAGAVLALTNFMVVLDTTIANVSVPHIAGSLAISPSQGTWIITSYAVAEAICVPLTGWLAARFGTVRTFTAGVIGFGIFSVLCGMSHTLTMLVICRIGQGLCGGPLMPLSQTLLFRIFPPQQRAQAMGVWAMTTVVAPILGPILGGTISDNWSWHWIFFINIPVVLLCAFGAMRVLKSAETPVEHSRIDGIGLSLLVLWVGALQLMLDLGREHDWFGDPMIVGLGLTAGIGLAIFLVWELTERRPIVDLSVFRHRGFTFATVALSATYAAFFASVVIIPQWLQVSMGYTATYAGYVTAMTGIAAVFMSPIAAKLTGKYDPRLLVCGGILWLAATSLLRTEWTSGSDFWTLALPQLLQGFGMPFFFIPLTTIALGAVEPEETASAAGVMSFLRTVAGALGTTVAVSLWDDRSRIARSEIVARLNPADVTATMEANGFSLDQVRAMVDRLVEQEAMAVAVNQIFFLSALIFVVAAGMIWLSPRPQRVVGPGASH